MCAINHSLDPPTDIARLEEKNRTKWNQTNNNRLTTNAFTIGALSDNSAISYTTELLKTNDIINISQFKNTGLTLNLMNTKKSEETLWQLYSANDKKIKTLNETIAKLESHKSSTNNTTHKKVLTKKRKAEKEHNQLINKKTNFIINLAVGLSSSNATQFKKEILNVKEKSIKENTKQTLPQTYYTLINESGNNDHKYLNHLKQYHNKNKDKKQKLTLLIKDFKANQQNVVDTKKTKKKTMNE